MDQNYRREAMELVGRRGADLVLFGFEELKGLIEPVL